MTLISKIVGTMLILGMLLAVWIDERIYLAKSPQKSRDSHEIAKTEPLDKDINVRSKDEPQTERSE